MSDWVRWETYVEAPKKLGFKSFLYDLNIKYGTHLEILNHDKGFFNETILFKFTGERSKVGSLREEYMQVVLERLEKQVNKKFNPVENHEQQKEDSNFLGQRCKVLGAEITYSPNNVKIDIWTNSDKQNDDIYNLAKNIKTHLGVEYKIALNSEGVTIDVNGNDEQIKNFADTVNHYLDWKIEPIIINEPRVASKNKM